MSIMNMFLFTPKKRAHVQMSTLPSPSYQVIIAKYNEKVDWIKYMNKSNIIIYDKSNKPIRGSIARKNIGMNIDTYFYHIVENYHKLPDYLVCIQGNPFDHVPKDITQRTIQKNITNIIQKKPQKTIPFFVNFYEENENNMCPSLKTPEYWNLFFNEPFPGKVLFAHGGCQYIIPKSVILTKPREFYIKILKMMENAEPVNYDPHNNTLPFTPDAINAWALERFFYHIFTTEITISSDF